MVSKVFTNSKIRGCTKSPNKEAQLHFCAAGQNNLRKRLQRVPNAAVWCYSVLIMKQKGL